VKGPLGILCFHGRILIRVDFKEKIYEYSNICPTRCNVTQFILSGNCSTCFGWYHYPSSGAQTTVSTTSGICHTVIVICRYRGRVGTGFSALWVAYHPKHVEHFPDKINCVTLHLVGYILNKYGTYIYLRQYSYC
jgi:hypothetical protein